MSNIEKEPQEIYEETAENISEQRQIRRDKLLKLQNEGRNPFLTEKWDVDAYSQEIKGGFDDFDGKEVSCAGRIMANRHMGKASFIDIKDKLGRIQCYIRQDEITPEEYEVFKTYDIGDIVGVKGSVFKTRHGEISIRVSDIALLSKSLRGIKCFSCQAEIHFSVCLKYPRFQDKLPFCFSSTVLDGIRLAHL